ncbi:Serine/threonine-protein kinase StkP [Pseudobythopirellula maris]|uniref:Serine/threonine-protein kinase StkP n=1 Tax=Pseudobythopirellula maris TaxID=2527991 RepID=A0A5C5ZTA4_9BACT|nr:protein kinase [Pseudobythopirellula maris]TWT90732.1 Serine/threonine-protein kinase StkP [Pseudobythopirellula maris]
MPAIATAEELAQRAVDANVLDGAQAQAVWGEFGSRNVSLGDFTQALLRKDYLTNYQIDRLTRGLRDGYYYGDYKVLYCVGAGTFARVFRAAHRETGKLVAVKVLRSRHSSDPKEAELFRREGDLCKGLVHPNIVPIHEVSSRGSEHFIVMDFIEGRNLRDFYKVRKKFGYEEASRIVSGMLAGLHYAFQKGVTHRDLKMSNVLVASNGVAMLVDFGLAGLDAETGDGDAANQRSIDYAGLERATSVRRDDIRSDIFFAGCIFWQLLAGKPPMAETRDRMQRLAKSRFKDIPNLLESAPETPLAISLVVNKAIEFDPQRRYQSPGDMLTDLKLALRRVGDGAAAGKRELASQEGIGPDGQPRKIMVVESDTKRQDVLRDLFKRNGYRVLVSGDPNRALERFASNPQAAEVILFCAATVGADALDAFNACADDAQLRNMPAVLLLEEAQASWAAAAKTGEHRGVVTMPVKLRKLREAVLAALGAQVAS